MILDGLFDHYVLLSLGAQKVTDRLDDKGVVIGVAVEPSVDISGYAAAFAAKGRVQLAAYANAKQWALATGGFTVTIGGTPLTFASDVDSIALMTGKVVRLGQPNPPTQVGWQLASGFVTIAAADFAAAAIKVDDFFQATFDALPAILAAIADGTSTSFADVDAASWPANHG